MKKLVSLYAAITVAAMCLMHTVFAAPLNAGAEFTASASADTVTLKGAVTPSETHRIAYIALYPGKTADMTDANNFADAVAAAGEFETESDGSFDISFKVKDNTGGALDIKNYPLKYSVSLSVDGYAFTKTEEFDFYGSEYTLEIIKLINAAKDAGDTAGMKSIIEKYYGALGIGNKIFEEKIKDSEPMFESFIKLFTALAKTDIGGIDGQFTDASVMSLVNAAETDGEISGLIGTYARELKLDGTTEYKTYTDIISDGLRKDIRTYILNHGDFTSVQDFADDVKQYTVMRAINGVIGWDNVRKAIEENAEILKVDLTLIKSTDDKADIYGRLIGRDFADYSAVRSAFMQAVTDSRNANPHTPGKGTGGGGGSTGGSGNGGGGNNFPAGLIVGNDSESKYFSDLDNYKWAETEINALAEKNIINGKSAGIFEPGSDVLREEFVKMIVLAADKYDGKASVDFDDISRDDWSYSYVASAVKSGIIAGIGDNMFGAGRKITREDMAVIIARLLNGGTGESTESSFADSDMIADYAKPAVSWAERTGLLKGDEGRFNPKAALSRAEAAVVLYRCMSFTN